MSDPNEICFNACNEMYSNSLDPRRIYCKKGCKSDYNPSECKEKACSKLCVKEEIGTDDSKWGNWSKVLSRAPADSSNCLESCYFGCDNKAENNND